MAILIRFILATAGFSWILTKSLFFNSIRQKITKLHTAFKGIAGDPKKKNFIIRKIFWFIDEVINCPGCMGFWAGLLFYPQSVEKTVIDYISYGCAGAISAYILINLSEKLRK